MAEIIPTAKRQQALASAVSRLGEGKPVALPTETVYGLAADATNGQAVAQIFELKGRPKFNPLICHVDGLEMALLYGQFDPIAEQLARIFWPGPLTLVVDAVSGSPISELATAGLQTIGLRCPVGIAGDIIRKFGKPLAAPSANRSGRISPTLAKHVAEDFQDAELLVVDGGPAEVGLESTIIRVSCGELEILRPGSVTAVDIERRVGVLPKLVNEGEIVAPGMMKSHYAPMAKVILNCAEAPDKSRMLGFGELSGDLNLSATGDLREAAANLYAHLKQLDGNDIEAIAVAPIPQDGLGTAINDRLTRAAAPRNQ